MTDDEAITKFETIAKAAELAIDELEQLQARNDRLRAEVAALEALRGER